MVVLSELSDLTEVWDKDNEREPDTAAGVVVVVVVSSSSPKQAVRVRLKTIARRANNSFMEKPLVLVFIYLASSNILAFYNYLLKTLRPTLKR